MVNWYKVGEFAVSFALLGFVGYKWYQLHKEINLEVSLQLGCVDIVLTKLHAQKCDT